MPNIKAAEKWVRQTGKRTQRNLDTKTKLKTLFKKAVVTGTDELLEVVESQIDKAATKGIIHKNKAARKKSRLARAVKAAAAQPTKTAKPTRSKAKPAAKSKAKAKKKTASA